MTLALPQTLVEDHQLMEKWKTCKEWNDYKFLDTKEPSNPGSKTKLRINQQEKKTCRLEDFAVPANHWVKIKESGLVREMKKKNQ